MTRQKTVWAKDDSNGTSFKVIELIALTLANPEAKDTANALLQAPLAPGCQHTKTKRPRLKMSGGLSFQVILDQMCVLVCLCVLCVCVQVFVLLEDKMPGDTRVDMN